MQIQTGKKHWSVKFQDSYQVTEYFFLQTASKFDRDFQALDAEIMSNCDLSTNKR